MDYSGECGSERFVSIFIARELSILQLDNEAFIHNKGPRTFRSESPVRFMEVICVHMKARILKSPFTILDIINHIYYQILYCVE